MKANIGKGEIVVMNKEGTLGLLIPLYFREQYSCQSDDPKYTVKLFTEHVAPAAYILTDGDSGMYVSDRIFKTFESLGEL